MKRDYLNIIQKTPKLLMNIKQFEELFSKKDKLENNDDKGRKKYF